MWSVQGKTAIVTGANSGIGFETARSLAQKGAKVTMICRNLQRGEAALAQIRREDPDASVDLLLADLSCREDVRRVAEEIRASLPAVHILVNNAGVYLECRKETGDGLEYTFALNHMGYFRLTMELLDLIKASAPARIINVASAAHRFGRMNPDDLQSRRRYSGFKVYSRSKTANILFTRALAEKLKESGVTVNCNHPGFVNTNFGKNNCSTVSGRIFNHLARAVAMPQGRGARNTIHLASSPDVSHITGAYFSGLRPRTPWPPARDEEIARVLWRESERLR